MNSTDPLQDALARTEEALQLLSSFWYQLAAEAVPEIAQRDGLSHEQKVRLLTTFQDVAAAVARSARVCRDAAGRVAA